jgi:N-carbamoylputrescine amidase
MIVKVALLQMMHAGTDQLSNLQKGDTFCRQAQEMGADIALFPEMWNIGMEVRFSGSEKR